MLTTEQFRARTKGVTRRLGWWNVKPGEILCGIEKGQGLKKGERVVRLGLIYVTSARPEPLDQITERECALEGFSHLTPDQFIKMFCAHNRCLPDKEVNRIGFEYVVNQNGDTLLEREGDSIFTVRASIIERLPECRDRGGQEIKRDDYVQIVEHLELPRHLVGSIGRIGRVEHLYVTKQPPRITITSAPRWMASLELPAHGGHRQLNRVVPVVALEKM